MREGVLVDIFNALGKHSLARRILADDGEGNVTLLGAVDGVNGGGILELK